MTSRTPGLFALIIEDFRTHREGIFAQGFWALLIYRVSHRRMNCRIPVLRQIWAVFNVLAQKFVEMTCGISLPEGTVIGRRLNIEHFGSIIVHGSVVIGDVCLIRHGVTLGNKTRERPLDAPRLGNGVDVGAGAKILGAITIGDGARIGANAVVTKDVPANAVAVGIPARILGERR